MLTCSLDVINPPNGGVTMLVKKFIMLLIICFLSTSSVMAENQQKPRVTISGSTIGGGPPIIIHMFYDTQADILCYSSRDSLQCFSYSELTNEAQERIKKLMESYRTSPNAQLTLPSIIMIPEK